MAGRQITYCFECSEYPCKQIKRLEKSYNVRYHASLMGNSKMVKEQGMAEILVKQKENYTGPECGGIISIHDAECGECQYRLRD